MLITLPAADIQVDTMDTYLKCRGLKSSNQGLVVFSGFHFIVIKVLQIIEGKCSNHIILESIETDTRACGICWLVWKVAQGVVSFIDDCRNINALIIGVVETLGKSNSDSS